MHLSIVRSNRLRLRIQDSNKTEARLPVDNGDNPATGFRVKRRQHIEQQVVEERRYRLYNVYQWSKPEVV